MYIYSIHSIHRTFHIYQTNIPISKKHLILIIKKVYSLKLLSVNIYILVTICAIWNAGIQGIYLKAQKFKNSKIQKFKNLTHKLVLPPVLYSIVNYNSSYFTHFSIITELNNDTSREK